MDDSRENKQQQIAMIYSWEYDTTVLIFYHFSSNEETGEGVMPLHFGFWMHRWGSLIDDLIEEDIWT